MADVEFGEEDFATVLGLGVQAFGIEGEEGCCVDRRVSFVC